MNLPIGFYLIGSFSTLAHETISWLPAIGFTARPLARGAERDQQPHTAVSIPTLISPPGLAPFIPVPDSPGS